MTQSPQNDSKYVRAKAVVDDFVARNRGRAAPNHWAFLGHLMWCRARADKAFLFALLGVACFHLAKQALKPAGLPTLFVKD
jgi:hypothetical protein